MTSNSMPTLSNGSVDPLASATPLDTCLPAAAVSDLPACIEQVARRLGAVYNRTPEQARFNLHADEFSVRAYLGTYLPRTVFEFMTIGQEMLGHGAMRQTLPANRPLRILDLGSGTGGAWMGLAVALFCNGYAQPLEIDAVDGNALALSKQELFVHALGAEAGVDISVTPHHRVLGPDVATFAADLQAVLAELNRQYDFVLVSKHLSEFYCAVGHAAQGVVYETLRLMVSVLQPNGYLVILDLATPIQEVGQYFPNIMAQELGAYLGDHHEGLRPVLPVPCAVSARGGCAGGAGHCYSQRELHFRHGIRWGRALHPENTKIAYRVLTHPAHAERIVSGYAGDLPYNVNAQRSHEACQHGKIVFQPQGFDGYLPPANRTATA
jgi:SAM-dependent methyltransferase